MARLYYVTKMCFAVADWLLRDEHHTHKELEASMVRFAHNYPNPIGGVKYFPFLFRKIKKQ